MDSNPYAPPNADITPPITELEAIRREHLKVESGIKISGVLFCMATLLLFFFAGINLSGQFGTSMEEVVKGTTFAILGLLQGAVGMGLLKLNPWTRIPGIILASFGLLVFPHGTVINALILVHIAGKKGKRVLSSDYKGIVDMTPHVEKRFSISMLLILVILVTLLIAIAVTAIILYIQKTWPSLPIFSRI